MLHEWSFYGLSGCVDLEGNTSRLESLLQSTLSIYSETVTSQNDRDESAFTKILIDIVSEESMSKMILVIKEGSITSTLLTFAGDQNIEQLLLEWLRTETGLVIFRVEFNHSRLIEVMDSMSCGSQANPSEYYRTRLIFDVDTHQKNLKRIEIELDKDTIKTFCIGETSSPFESVIIPYIYQETGIMVSKLTLSTINMAGFGRFSGEGLTTLSSTLADAVLIGILKSIQFD